MPFFLRGTEARDDGRLGEVGTKAQLSGGCEWVSSLLWGATMVKRLFLMMRNLYAVLNRSVRTFSYEVDKIK